MSKKRHQFELWKPNYTTKRSTITKTTYSIHVHCFFSLTADADVEALKDLILSTSFMLQINQKFDIRKDTNNANNTCDPGSRWGGGGGGDSAS